MAENSSVRARRFLPDTRYWLRDFILALLLAFIVIVFLYQPVQVEGTSMMPALSHRERIFINKFVYRFEPISRGDIVVFWYPLDPSKSYIKRVVGLPGEQIGIQDGQVYVNGKPLVETYLAPGYTGGQNMSPICIDDGHYFLLGDHRGSSSDSRTWGSVDQGYIYGKAVFAYWPVEQFGVVH